MQVVDFLRVANSSTYKTPWSEVVRRGWQTVSADPNGDKNQGRPPKEPRYNTLYEDIFSLPERASRFIRTYFLRIPRLSRQEGDPRTKYSLRQETALVSWPLVVLFLERIMGMEKKRIEAIRNFGDKLAHHTRRRGGPKFFRMMLTENNPNYLRGRLVKANVDTIKAGESELFDMDSYIDVFEEGEEIYRADWRLARDLVLMRMIDQLKDWLARHPEVTEDMSEDSDDLNGQASSVAAE
jgi:CRISPR-associated protein Cst1